MEMFCVTKQEYKLKNKKLEELKKEIEKENRKRRLEIIHKNSELVGKCFVRQKTTKTLEYYKVISEYSENEFRVECLTFQVPFRANIDRLLSMHGSRYPDCSIDAVPFKTESVMIRDLLDNNTALSELTEITEKEFYSHMNTCFQQFQEWSKYKDIIKENNNELNFKKQKED